MREKNTISATARGRGSNHLFKEFLLTIRKSQELGVLGVKSQAVGQNPNIDLLELLTELADIRGEGSRL